MTDLLTEVALSEATASSTPLTLVQLLVQQQRTMRLFSVRTKINLADISCIPMVRIPMVGTLSLLRLMSLVQM